MRITNKKAYTLAEILIVVLILTVIFAAFAPIFTRRTIKNYHSRYDVWDWSDFTQWNASSYSDASDTNEFFFGATPNSHTDIDVTFKPLSKVVVRSGLVTSSNIPQRQIQFRYGRKSTSDAGEFAGSWLMAGSNMLLGGAYPSIPTSLDNLKNNVAIGYMALNSIESASGNVAIGYYALSQLKKDSSKNVTNNVAIGYNAGNTLTQTNNTFVGSGAGSSSDGAINDNVAIGYNAGKQMDADSDLNTYIGAFSGGGVIDKEYKSKSSKNVAIGYNALSKIKEGDNNVAIGAYALSSLETGSNNVAIGYNACAEVKGSNKTCIGFNAGPHEFARNKETGGYERGTGKYYSTAYFLGGLTDSQHRTYIGSQPYNYGGDAVLEIHNMDTTSLGSGDAHTSEFNVTTVVNGNLIVRGRPYFTVGNSLYHFRDIADSTASGLYMYGGATICGSDTSIMWGGSCINLSDRRLKNINSRYTYGLDKLRQVNVYNYNFKNDKEKKPHVGVIAQELQKIFPTAVYQGDDGYLRIRWDEMFFAVVNAIKELDRRVASIIKRSTSSQSQITKLEKKNSELKNQVDKLTIRVNKLKNQ